MGPDEVRQHHRLGAQAVRINHPAVVPHRGEQLLARGNGLLFQLECQYLSHRQTIGTASSGPNEAIHLRGNRAVINAPDIGTQDIDTDGLITGRYCVSLAG